MSRQPDKLTLVEVHYSTESILQRMKEVPKDNQSRTMEPNGSFTTTTFDKTIKRVENGWDGVTNKVTDFGEKLVHLMTNARPGLNALEYREDGDWVDIGRYLDGDTEECFVSLVEGSPVPTRSLNMIVSITANCSTNASALQMRGAAIAFLIDYFRGRGINIALWAVDSTAGCPMGDGSSKNILAMFNINTNEGYSLNQLASYIALPDFFRRVGFAVSELLAGTPNCGSYGRAWDFIENGKAAKEVPRQAIDILGGEEAIAKALYFGTVTNAWDNFDYTVDQICNIIDTFNGVNKEVE